MRLTIVNLLISGAIGETKRPASILARKHRKMNPPYAGRRTAADASYKVGGVKEARRRLSFVRVARPPPRPPPASGRGGTLHLRRAPSKKRSDATGILQLTLYEMFADAANHATQRAPSPACGVGRGGGRLKVTPPFCGAAPAGPRPRGPLRPGLT